MNTSHDSETPAHRQQVFTACAFIHHDFNGVQKVFLPKRADTKKLFPNVFELPGGHIEYGESHVEGLKREIHEEFDKEIVVGDPFYVFDYFNEVKGSHSSETVYFAQFVGDNVTINLKPDEHSEYDWFAEDEISRAYTSEKGPDNIEFIVIQRGFELLSGASVAF